MKYMLRIGALLLLSLSTSCLWSQAEDTRKEARIVKYASKDIIHVTTRPRFTTLIVLPEKERILDYIIGDKDLWVLEGSQNFCYLKPSKAGLATSVTLITAAGNIYSFYATSAPGPSGEQETSDLKLFVELTDDRLLHAIDAAPRFVPAAEVEQVKEAARLQVDAAKEEAERFQATYPIKEIKSDYKFEKNKKPFLVSSIYHDQKFTYIQSSASEKPTLYEVKDGSASLVNFDLRDGVYIVPKILDKGYLVVGKHKSTFERQGDL